MITRRSKQYQPSWKRRALEKAAITVEGRAINRVPVDTGRLKGSITHETYDEEAHVGTNIEYAPHIEYGTRSHMINSPVKIRGVGWRYIKRHPGTKAQPFLRPALDGKKAAILRDFKSWIRKAMRVDR